LFISFLKRRPVPRATQKTSLPSVTVIITARNEAANLTAKLENMLSLDYPGDKLEIIVANDGSTDATENIVNNYRQQGVILITGPDHPGKTIMQNRAAAQAHGDILIFSDANSHYAPDAIRQLVRHFSDTSIGCVGGQLRYTRKDTAPAGAGEILYWRYENFLKRQENKSGSIIGVNGAIYAIPRHLYQDLPPTMMSDLVVPLRVWEQGYRTVYEPRAGCYEPVYENAQTSFLVKKRIVLRALTSVWEERRFLNVFRFKFYAIKLISHKLLRWLAPCFLLLLYSSNYLLSGSPEYFLLFIIQNAFYGIAAIGFLLNSIRFRLPLFYFPFYFCLVNLAALLSIFSFLSGKRIQTWDPQR